MNDLTSTEILGEYNRLAEILGRPVVKRFSDRKTAERRLAGIRSDYEAQASPEPPAGEYEGRVENAYATPEGRLTVTVSNVRPVRPARESAPSAKFNPRKSDADLSSFMRDCLERGMTSAAAVREAITQFPNATRIQVKHSAGVAGINPLTARNMFDKMRKA